MENAIPKLRQSPVISEKPGNSSEKIENFDELQLTQIIKLLAEIVHIFPP